MTGMKEVAGEDPFADDSSGEDSGTQLTRAGEPIPESDPAMEGGSSTTAEADDSETEMSIPYKYRRDSVQDGRDRMPLFLHPETKTAEREAMRELEERFDDTVSLTDLREAL